MTIEEMRRKKTELGYSYEKIAELSGVPLGTVQKVLGGITKSPRYQTLQALEKVFLPASAGSADQSPAYGRNVYESASAGGCLVKETAPCYGNGLVKEAAPGYGDSLVREAAPDYGAGFGGASAAASAAAEKMRTSGGYTLEDYYALPDERRVELIDGVFYDMAAPTGIHQLIAGRIHADLLRYIDAKKGNCVPFIAPFDVQLDCDDKTMVQPDVLIICDREKLKNRALRGAPDFVVEILSESTKSKDQLIKLNKYFHAGVKEYWIVNPWIRQIMVYDFRNGFECRTYQESEPVPVGIFDGDCRVDFGEIFEYVRFLEE